MKEKRLAALLSGRDPGLPALERALVEAQVRGSLELAGLVAESDADALRRAIAAVDPKAPLTVQALVGWQAALTGETSFRRQPRERAEGPPPAPVEFIASRLAIVEQWLGDESSRELKPAQAGALARFEVHQPATVRSEYMPPRSRKPCSPHNMSGTRYRTATWIGTVKMPQWLCQFMSPCKRNPRRFIPVSILR